MMLLDDSDVTADQAPVTTLSVAPSWDGEFVVLVANQAGDQGGRAQHAQANLSPEKTRDLIAALTKALAGVSD